MIGSWSLIGPNGEPAEDFRFDERGRIVCDDSVATAIVLALDNYRRRWWANPAHGSRVAELVSGTPSPDMQGDLETAVREALADLERTGRIRDVAISATVRGSRGYVAITVFDVAKGKPITVEVEPL